MLPPDRYTKRRGHNSRYAPSQSDAGISVES